MSFLVGIVLTLWTISLVFSAEMEHSKLTQHAEVRVHHIQGKSIAEIHRELLPVHSQSALSVSTIQCWYHKFEAGSHDISQKRTGGHVSKVTDEVLDKVRNLLEQDNTMCIHVIANRTGLSLCTVHHILWNKLKLQK